MTKEQKKPKCNTCGKHHLPWVAVDDRMPKSPTQYLCCDMKPNSSELPSIYTATTWSKAEGFYADDGSGKLDVRVYPTHWMPIVFPCPECNTCGDTGKLETGDWRDGGRLDDCPDCKGE